MKIGSWAEVVLWLISILAVDAVDTFSLETIRVSSQERHGHTLSLTKSLRSHRRQNNLNKQSGDYAERSNYGFTLEKSKKRHGFETSSKTEIHFPRNARVTSIPGEQMSKKIITRSSGLHRATKFSSRQRNTIFEHFNSPNIRNKRRIISSPEESDDSLIKRSRNRVRLKSLTSQHLKNESQFNRFTTTENVSKKALMKTDSPETKRQRISEGIMPYQIGTNSRPVMQGEEMRFPANSNRFFGDSIASNANIRAINPSHYYAPAVHKFLPAEHRYTSSPIHRYLSSPVIFKEGANDPLIDVAQGTETNKDIAVQQRPFVDGQQRFLQGPLHHRQRIMIVKRPHVVFVKRPLQSNFLLPAPVPPKIAFYPHHPLPLPPQRFPVPLLLHGPRPGPFVIVHHREFYRPSIDSCNVNPCKNGGTCTAVVNTFKCICPVGYKGDRCQVQSKCNPNPCKNFGRCTELPDDFECTCHTGFHGKSCELESKCDPNPCKNGGTCTENTENYICSCVAGFMGKNCEQESKCLPVNPCKNGGVCNEGLSGYKCNCRDGYFGINCEVRATSTACDSYPCHNGATCVADIYDSTKYSCYCDSGYTGLGCEEKGYESLSFQNSPCGPINPCLFGGHCIPKHDEYTCLCPEGRGGSRCEHLFQEKICNGCHHHAVCIYNKCACRPGYTGDGKICHPQDSHCHPNPCENGGTCHEPGLADPRHFDWWCECAKGYNGPHCHEFDPCSNFKCHNGGRCEVTNNVPQCDCEAPYQGVSCLLDNVCLPKDGVNRNPCLNGGKCDFTDYGEVRCTCPLPYEGPTCAVNKCDKCDKTNAFCDQGICKCKPPYTGDGITCEEPSEPPPKAPPTDSDVLSSSSCNPNKCLNGAQCIEAKDTFFCVCPEHTFGRLCEKKTKPTTAPPKKVACHPNPCLNGGICKETGVNQDFDCICHNPRFKGRFCDVDMCAECDPHARCVNGKCFCRKGYKGDGFSCKKVTPNMHCPQHAVVTSGNTCLCNPGYYMSYTGKRVCIPVDDQGTVRALPAPKNDRLLEDSPARRGGQQWSEDIIVTEYGNLGCWSDTTEWRNPSKRAMMVLEGLDPLLADSYQQRKQPISKCADVAKRLGLRVFGVQNGGQCFGGADEVTYKKYGPSEKCVDGIGGPLANDVYKL